MMEGLSDTALLRIAIGIAALVLFAVIVFTSRRKPGQGKRTPSSRPEAGASERQEPTLREILEADARSARSAERARRSASLAAMQAAARSGGARSTARESWDDFCVAQAEVERLRAQVRASGSGALYRDAWSGTAGAIGSGWAEGQGAVWADLPQMAPYPVLFEDGFSLADVVQGALGDCYMLACLAELAAGQGSGGALDLNAVLDSLFVTGEANAEGVYCVRLWVQRRWVHYFMDGRLP